MKKLAVIVGHNEAAQGAVRADTGETEWSWNGRLARAISTLSPSYGISVQIFFRQAGMGYSAEIDDVYHRADKWGADATVELHFNSFGNPLAQGTETLTSTSKGGRALGAAVQREIVRELGLRKRGAKAIGPRERGGRSLYAGAAPAILVEPYFGSNPDDLSATDEPHEMTGLANAILAGAADALGVKPPAPVRPVKPAKTFLQILLSFLGAGNRRAKP